MNAEVSRANLMKPSNRTPSPSEINQRLNDLAAEMKMTPSDLAQALLQLLPQPKQADIVYEVSGHSEPQRSRQRSLQIRSTGIGEAMQEYRAICRNTHPEAMVTVSSVTEVGRYAQDGKLHLTPISTTEDRNLLPRFMAEVIASHPDALKFAATNTNKIQADLLYPVLAEANVRFESNWGDYTTSEMALSMINRRAHIIYIVETALEHADQHGYTIDAMDMALTAASEACESLGSSMVTTKETLQQAAQAILDAAQDRRQDIEPEF